MAFDPYLFFGGNCRAAFTRYHEVFGGDLVLLTMADAPDSEDVPEEQKDLIIHAAITFDDGTLLMGSDDPTTTDFGPVQGMMASYSATDADDAHRVHAALADGGVVTQEVIQTFFSPAFGMCTDQFGTPWMVSAPGEGQ